VDGLIDLPFALPTAVAGIRSQLYIPRMVGLEGFSRRLESNIIYSPGYSCCLGFHRIPFVVRTVQPVLEVLMLKWRKRRHALEPPDSNFLQSYSAGIVSGVDNRFALAFSRALGEYGSVVFISGNMPMKTEITPL